jgi:antitoxin component of RelBE/YafQ-DinJ toxin-antitoxin module
MGRPKLLQSPARVNLVLDQSVKDLAVRMAQERGLSLGQMITILINEEIKRGDSSNTENE